jgi:hypothetical protein
VNNGCLVKFANYRLTGFCGFILAPDDIVLAGTREAAGNKLYWQTSATHIKEYALQRSADGINYNTIHTTVSGNYNYRDDRPFAGNTYYRLKLTTNAGQLKYSNIILMKDSKINVSVYPNPVQDKLYVDISTHFSKNYLVEISDIAGQKIFSKSCNNIQHNVIEYPRTKDMGNGVYFLIITDLHTREQQTFKLVYR